MTTISEPVSATAADEDFSMWENTVLHRVEAGDVRLPVMPSAATRALEMARDPNLDISDLTAVLDHDPAIAANILRVASSAAYGGGTDIQCLDGAINRIGTRTFIQLVSAFAIQSEIYGGSERSDLLTGYRRHASATACVASDIARRVRIDGGSAFLCGLLFTVGKPVILHLIQDLQRLLERTASEPTIETLVEQFHVEMARQICREWQMPPVIQAVCGRADTDDSEDFQTEKIVTSFADRLAGWVCGFAESSVDELADTVEAGFLQVSADDVQDILDAARESSDL